MNRELYYRGRKGMQWGIWDTDRAGWILKIEEDTPMLAEARLYQKIGREAKNPKYQPRPLPQKKRDSETTQWEGLPMPGVPVQG